MSTDLTLGQGHGRQDMTEWSLSSVVTALVGAVGIMIPLAPRIYARLKRDNKLDHTEEGALKMVDSAVAHWQRLYEVAWREVAKEREMREVAERRAATAMNDVEGLRAEVAALRRQIDVLSAMVKSQGGLHGA